MNDQAVPLDSTRPQPASAGKQRDPSAPRGYPELQAPAFCTLDHDGCVVCADAGILVRVMALAGDDALCEDASGNQAHIAVELVTPVYLGDVLLTHGGVAIGKVIVRRGEKAS